MKFFKTGDGFRRLRHAIELLETLKKGVLEIVRCLEVACKQMFISIESGS